MTRSFRTRQMVEVRSCAEILATLDAQGKLEGIPFMPEMARYCGGRYPVQRRADRSCVAGSGLRRLTSTVFLLDLRCDGAAHDGCQRACLLFWKEAWLIASDGARRDPDGVPAKAQRAALAALPTRRGDAYLCQSTELLSASSALSRWDMRPLLRDVRWGELSIAGLLRILLRTALRRCLGRRGGPGLTGAASAPSRGDLNLVAGEPVAVRSARQICGHLDANGGNRGLIFQPTMDEAIGRNYKVAFPVTKIILEQNGKMVALDHTVALEGQVCQGAQVFNCPRAEYLYWRECWLRRDAPPRQDEH